MVRDHCGWIDLDQGQELEDEFEADLQVVAVTAVLDTCETPTAGSSPSTPYPDGPRSKIRSSTISRRAASLVTIVSSSSLFFKFLLLEEEIERSPMERVPAEDTPETDSDHP